MRRITLLVVVCLVLLIAGAQATTYSPGVYNVLNNTALLHLNWAPGTQNFTDQAGGFWYPIPTGYYPNVTTKKWGNASLQATNAAATLSAPNSSAWVWGNNHTIELWFYPMDTASNSIITAQGIAGTYSPVDLRWDGVNKRILLYASSTGSSWNLANGATSPANSVPLNTWSHIEIDYANPRMRVYVNGLLNISPANFAANPYVASQNKTIGTLDASTKLGFEQIDEYAEWNITLHQANFTPPGYEYTTTGPAEASFTQVPNPSSIDQTVQFTDTSGGNPVTWLWDFGDGNTSTSQNPVNAYPAMGAYTILFNITNSSGYWSNISATHTVVNVSGFNQQNIFMAGQFVSTVHVTADGIALPDVAVTTSDTQSANTSVIGYANFTHPMGTYLYYFVKSGYDSKTVSIIIDSDTVTEVQMAKSVTTVSQKQNTLYPHETRFICIDRFGNRLAGLEVTARMDNTTLLGNWLQALYGVDAQTSPALNATMSGSTDSFGSIVFPVIASGKYTMTFTGPTIVGGTSTKTIYPDEGTTVIILATTNSEMVINKWGFLNGTLLTGEPNSSWIFLNFSYTDLSLTTTQITYYVAFPNQSLKYIAVSPATPTTNQSLNKSYAVPNIKGNAYVWGWFSNSTLFGNSSGSQGITLKGPSGMLIDIFSPRTGWD